MNRFKNQFNHLASVANSQTEPITEETKREKKLEM